MDIPLVIKMRLNKFILLTLLACVAVPQAALANDPCSSIATRESSQEIRKFENKELILQIPANYRILWTMQGLMIHSPWSYEVYTCQLNSKYGSGYVENGIVVNLMIPEQATELVKRIYQIDPQTVETAYPGTTAKMFVMAGPEAASAIVLFVKNGKVVSIEIPVNSNDDGTGSTEIPEIYKSTVDLIMSSIQVK
ncbi:hypothetical protein [Nostoc sp. DSM 114160]